MQQQVEVINEYQDFDAEPQLQPIQKYRENQYGSKQQLQSDLDEGLQYELLDGEEEQETQDYYVDKPPEAVFKPKEQGIDVYTQIVDTELFDFDLEVMPILQVLVGKTINQSRMELIQEMEKEEFIEKKRKFQKIRNAELLVTQRMEQKYIRKLQEKERRDLQHQLNTTQQTFAHQKIISRLLAKKLCSPINDNVLHNLENLGVLRDDMLVKIQFFILPWLIENTRNKGINQNQLIDRVKEDWKKVEEELKNQHTVFMQKEVNRRNQILKDREDLRLRKEDYKQKKKAWQLKQQLKNERYGIYQKIQQLIEEQKLQNVVDNILASNNFTNGYDGDQQLSVNLLGGPITQTYITLSYLQKLIQQETLEPLSDQQIKQLINLLVTNSKTAIYLNLNKSYQEKIEQFLKQVNFHSQIQDFLSEILQNPSEIFQNELLQFLQLDVPTLKIVLESFLQIYLSTQDIDQSQNQEQQQPQIPQINPDLKNKVFVTFDDYINLRELQQIVRLRIKVKEPEVENQEVIQQENEVKEVQLEEAEVEEIKEETPEERFQRKLKIYEEYVNTFNGEEFYRQRGEDVQLQTVENVQQYNFSSIKENQLVLDERASYVFRQAIMNRLQQNESSQFLKENQHTILVNMRQHEDDILQSIIKQNNLSEIQTFDLDC